MKKNLVVLLIALAVVAVFVGCSHEVKTYTVTFDSNGGTGTAPSQSVAEGKKATKPDTNPVSSDKYKTFKYWSADNGATEFKFNETPITKDIVLQAFYRDYEVGDTGPAGGKIFYVASEEQTSTYGTETLKWKYLEAAPSDATSGGASKFTWGDNGSFGTGTAIGDGWVNAKKFLADTEENVFRAAQVCFSYGDGTDYDDWFLPSKDELALMYNKKDIIGGFDTSEGRSYWTSSAPDTSTAYAIRFDNGNPTSYNRTNITCKIRPIRAF